MWCVVCLYTFLWNTNLLFLDFLLWSWFLCYLERLLVLFFNLLSHTHTVVFFLSVVIMALLSLVVLLLLLIMHQCLYFLWSYTYSRITNVLSFIGLDTVRPWALTSFWSLLKERSTTTQVDVAVVVDVAAVVVLGEEVMVEMHMAMSQPHLLRILGNSQPWVVASERFQYHFPYPPFIYLQFWVLSDLNLRQKLW